MNTKGIKFLAVLAVLAMVFVAFAATVPAEQDDATTAKDWTTNVTTATTIGSDEVWTVKGNVTVSATLTIEGSLVMSESNYPTIAAGGKIVVANGGRIVSTSSSYPIMVEATSADVLVVENGGIFGYYAATGETIDLYGGIVGIKTGTAQTLDAASEAATSEITGQMITGAFTVSTDANLLFKIKGAINAYTTLDSADSGKYAIPRMGLYATFDGSGNFTYTAPVSTSGDLTIASGVSIFAAGLKVSKETTLTNNGYIYALKSGVLTAGTFQLETDSSNGGKFVNNGKAIGSVVVSSTTSIGTAIFNMPGNAGGATPKYSEVLSITGYTLQYSGKLYLSGSLNKMTGQTDALTVTLASATYVPDNGSVIVGDGVTLTASSANYLTGTVCQTSESNKMVLTAFAGSIVGGGVVTVDDASAKIEFVKGTYTGTIVTNVNKLTVDSSASVTFAAATGAVAEAHIYGTIAGTANANTKPTFTKTYLYAGSTADLTNIASTATYDANAAEYIIHGKLEGDTVVGTAQLDDDLEIPEGYTLTVNSSLDLNGKILYVYGTLILSTGAEIIDSKDDSQNLAVDATIVLGPDSEFQNNGVLGRNATVKVALYENGISETKCLTAQSIKGLSIAYGKVNKEPAMIIGGSITKTVPNLSSVIPTLVVKTVFIDDMSVMTGVKLAGDNGIVTLMKGAEVEINTGATLAANLTVVYDSSITVNGLINGATITAQTFIYKTAEDISKLSSYTNVMFTSVVASSNTGTLSVSGFTVAVDRVQYSVGSTVYYDQRAYVAGDLKIVLGTATAAASADLNIDGLAFVPAEYELNGWSNTNGVTAGISGTNGDLVVEGMVNNYSKMQSSTAKPFVGAKYSLTVAGVTTTYIANLADGIAMVGVAEEVIFSGNTVAPGTAGTDGYGVGTYELTADLEIPAGYIVSFGGTETTSDASLIIPEEISVKVMSGASLDAKVIAGLDGQVIVYEGGTCNNMTTDIYQVSWTEGTTKIYAGLAVALSKAAPGDVITFQGDNSASKIKAITIPSEVTLKVTGTLYVAKITVEEDGILYTTSSGSIIMKTNGSTYAGIANEGTMDVADGGFSFKGTPNQSVVTSTGALVYSTSTEFTDASVYGARISDDDGNYVLTTITLAVLAGATTIDIPDKYVNLEKEYLLGAILNVAGNAAFVGLDITGSTLNVTGTVSGVITGISGTELEVVKVALDTFTGTLTDKYTLKTAEIYDYTFKSETAATVKGIEIASGKFTVGADINAVSATDKSLFVIDEDAVLTVSADATIGSVLFKLIDIDGSVTVPSAKTLTIASPAVIDGEVTVTGKLKTAELSIVGTLKTASTGSPEINFSGETEILGTLTVTSVASAVIGDKMYIGEPEIAAAPVIDGVLTFGADTFVIDYTGELDEDYFLYDTGASAFMINDIDYFNVFFMGSNNLVSKVLDVADFTALIGLEIQNITNVTAWYDLATGKALGTSATLEDEMILLFVADITKVPLQMSWANGLSLYVDGVKMTTTNYSLAVGAHTVSAQVNAGYACDNMKITFDGAPITAAGIIITVDDTDSVIAVSGDVYVPEPEPVTPEEKSEWTITTILLVVLVILIAIMAVIVALRLNRS